MQYVNYTIFFANDVNILNKLVLNCANINHEDIYGKSALYYAMKSYRHDIVKAILNFGPSTTNIRNMISDIAPKFYENFNDSIGIIDFPSYYYNRN